MGESFLAEFVAETQREVSEALEVLVTETGIKDEVLQHAKELATTAATHILDESKPPLERFKPLDLEEDNRLKYLLVLEFLQSAGFKFAPTVLKYESQHPDLEMDRRQFGRDLKLRTFDRTPYLIQLLEAIETPPA
jgi:hypothetical protein